MGPSAGPMSKTPRRWRARCECRSSPPVASAAWPISLPSPPSPTPASRASWSGARSTPAPSRCRTRCVPPRAGPSVLAKRIIPCLDAKRTEPKTISNGPPTAEAGLADPATTTWHVFTHGGRNTTGRDAVAWAQEAVALGAGEILLTSMDRDGTKDGYDLELTRAVSESVSVPVIASGGAGSLEHLYEGLVEGCADAALAASIFHFGTHTIAEAKAYLHGRGVEVRSEP